MCVFPDRADVLVIEDRHHAVVFLERVGDFLKEPLAGIELLPEVIHRIVAVLANTQHAINGDRLATDRDRLFNRIENGDAVLL